MNILILFICVFISAGSCHCKQQRKNPDDQTHGILVFPRIIASTRQKRSSATNQKDNESLMRLHLSNGTLLQEYRIRRNDHLILDQLQIEGFVSNSTLPPKNCFYVSLESSFERAALEDCDGATIRGVVTIHGHMYYLTPSHDGHGHRVKRSEESDSGYYLDKFWKTTRKRKKDAKYKKVPSEVVCNGPYCEYFRVKRDEPKWLETVVAADYSVIDFHGKETVTRYVLTLMNIVSAIYGDQTLSANLKFVILRLIFYEKPEDCPIVEGRSKKSLENVNKWNYKLWHNTSEHRRHDIALWITKLNIGGPSGYAPVGGVCDPSRSCSLNKDEGLSSAFIIAHELGHLLGLSHDGDPGASNNCNDEVDEGSIMANTVGATFSYFHWSPCSAGEYHYKSSSWKCMFNYPHDYKNSTFIGDVIEFTYSLDDQCRMEFGNGFIFCMSFELNDPCIHLWCSHKDSPNLCKTKRGSPMDGTECGKDKWCINGYCESISTRKKSKDGLWHNTMDGSWSDWSSWRKCSRSCNGGVQFRTRLCDNPRPAYGGAPCPGIREDFRLCNIDPCFDKHSDFRAQQCKELFRSIDNNSSRSQSRWHPYEHENGEYKCKLSCFNRQNAEYYQSGENVIDGTLCSYDDPSNICVQGKCLILGCDKIVGSSVKEDACGVCGGDGTKCIVKTKKFVLSMAKDNFVKVCNIPKGVRSIELQSNSLSKNVDVSIGVRSHSYSGFLLKNFEHNYTTFISDGTKFTYKKMHGNETLSARGPLQSGIFIYLYNEGPLIQTSMTKYEVNLKYIVSKENDPLFTIRRYEWTSTGWSKCSSKCGGGTQKLLMRCVDKKTGRRIRRHSQCRKSRPAIKRRSCNNFSCHFQWFTTPWEDCNQSCGMEGHQIRRIFCVPRNNMSTFHDPKLCKGKERPVRKRFCNRVPCPMPWLEKGWRQCTSDECGIFGKREKILYCPKKGVYYLWYKANSKRGL
ncbi:A disintegrin and metalloproteinase with thrombospondin motifs 3 [Lepeophtheirus salmonis]|uniref:A disintegrin and metalloproteinase with thrombospondin motifs 3 n=1 Tax=Lepeophtheirus salmonis TaxID=72036 RepID=UPI001AE76EE9|nr:A disintegrin and metalloproteinase with thrombospondin motifs 3-like [Lepeophtheirus salmonis]